MKKKILFFVLVLMAKVLVAQQQLIPIAHRHIRIPEPKTVTFTLSGTPTFFNVVPAFYKYDKKFAFSIRYDDELDDSYNTVFKLFRGRNPSDREGTVYPDDGPYFFTSGTAQDRIFFSATQAVEYNNVGTIPQRLSFLELAEMYSNGWHISNQSYSGQTGIGTPPDAFSSDPLLRSEEVRYQILEPIFQMRDTMGINMRHFGAPNADLLYKPVALELLADNVISFNANVDETGDQAYRRSMEEWSAAEFWGPRTHFGIADDGNAQNGGLPNATWYQEMVDFFTREIAEHTVTNHKWFLFGCHAAGSTENLPLGNMTYTGTVQMYDYLFNNYGAAGDDSMWMAPEMSVTSYVDTREDFQYTTSISGNTVTITFNFADCDPLAREHAVTLLFNTDQTVTDISQTNFTEFYSTTTPIVSSYTDGNNYDGMVTVGYQPDWDKAVTKRATVLYLLTAVQTSPTQENYDAALAAVNSLPPGPFKDSQQAILDGITVGASVVTIKVDAGDDGIGIVGPPWNSLYGTVDGDPLVVTTIADMVDTEGNPTGIGISALNFDVLETNSIASGSYPLEDIPTGWGTNVTVRVLNDSFETFNANPAVITLTGLDPTRVYDLEMTSSRGSIDEGTRYDVMTGPDTGVFDWHVTRGNGTGGVWDIANLVGIRPDNNNEIILNVQGCNRTTGAITADEGYFAGIIITEREP